MMAKRFAAALVPAVLLAGAMPAGAAGDGESAVERLRRGEALICEPAYDVFCANIHVACAGRSRLPTGPLRLEVDGEAARLTPEPGSEAVSDPVGRASFDAEPGSLLVLFEPQPGYFNVEADGRFSQRIYRRNRAWMSRGVCR